jgi:hypothetical protein
VISEQLKDHLREWEPNALSPTRQYETYMSHALFKEFSEHVKFTSDGDDSHLWRQGSYPYSQNLWFKFIPKYEMYCYLRSIDIRYIPEDDDYW